MLALRGVTKSYGDRRVLDELSLEVTRGEPTLLVGLNGAGKTTLLRIATGFLDPDAGEVIVDGRFGYLPEHAPVPIDLRVVDHLTFRAKLKRCGGVDAAMVATDVASLAKRTIGTLSKGQRQRVALADALLGDPPLVVMDEPSAGLDAEQLAQFCAILDGLADRAVLVSSHAVKDLESHFKRTVKLVDGKISS